MADSARLDPVLRRAVSKMVKTHGMGSAYAACAEDFMKAYDNREFGPTMQKRVIAKLRKMVRKYPV